MDLHTLPTILGAIGGAAVGVLSIVVLGVSSSYAVFATRTIAVTVLAGVGTIAVAERYIEGSTTARSEW